MSATHTDQTRMTRLGLIQTRCCTSVSENLANASLRIAEAANAGANIICLPELFTSEYFCQTEDNRSAFDLAEPIPGPTTEVLSALARRHEVVLVGGTIFERANDGKHYNSAPVFDADGSLLGIYRKIHIPYDPLYYEQGYFSAGNLGVRVFETRFARITVLICFDQWFPELARVAVLAGAEIIVYPSAIGHFVNEEPEEGSWQTPWRDIQRAHAIANNVYVAAVNRVSIEGGLDFWGGSFVCDPMGYVIAEANGNEQVLYADCDLARVSRLQELWGFLQARKPSEYRTLTGLD
ncbi:MAG: carbon-nitrogen hydrolase [Acidobacteria bacterium]|nr:carbon-nitrogen hydrolase [Acidobacteriota bacterium]